MANALPSLVLTAASGTVGRGLPAAAQARSHVRAVARRPQRSAGGPLHPAIEWSQVAIDASRVLEGGR